ncbi:MAG: PAS domain S-box protein, partial [Balneola sp.]
MIDRHAIKEAIGAPLFESKTISCCLTDKKLRFVFINKAFAKKSGYSEEELIGKSISVLLSKKVFLKEFARFITTGFTGDKKWPYISKNGDLLQASIENSRVKINRKTYTLTLAFDISREYELENKLKKERDRLQSAVEAANLGLWDFNFRTKEFYANDIWWEMLGYPAHEWEDAFKFYTTLIHPEDASLLLAEKDRIVTTGDPNFDLQLRLRKKSGAYIWIHSQGKVLEFGENNFIYHAIGTHTDITNQKKAELVIQESEKKYRLLTESLPNIIWTADKDGYLTYMNRHGLAFFGKKKSALSNWEWKNFVPPESVDEVYEKWTFAHQTATAINHVHTFINQKGKERWFQVLIFPQKDHRGVVQSWIGIASDIDDVVRAEQSLKLSNERLRSLINASPVAIYSLNKDGIVQDFWNPAAEKLLGWTREEVMGKRLPFSNQESEANFDNRINEAIEGGQYSGIIKRANKFGEERWLEVTGGCIYHKDGTVSEIIVTLLDITELEKNRNRLKHSLKEKETLLQEIHHRVKNNLAIVVSLLQLQVFRSEEESEKYRLTEAQNRVHSIAMVHELLYQSEDFSSVDLITYYEKLIKTIRNNMQVKNTDVQIELDIGISSLNINQAIPLGLLINELATNSFKYAFQEKKQGGEIALKIRKAGERIFVSYSDNGPGFDMSAEEFSTGLG